MYNILIWHLCTLQNGHHNKFSYHLSHYKVNTVLLIIFTMLYITFPWLTYFITGSLYFLIPLTHFAHPPNLLSSGEHQSVLCISESRFYFHIQVKSWSICLSLFELSLLIFCWDFSIYVHQGYWPVTFFFCDVLLRFGYQGNTVHVKWIWKISNLFNFLKEFERIGITSLTIW